MTNESRGEVDVVLDGKTWTMRPDFQTLRAIEHATGTSVMTLARQVYRGDARLDDVAKALAFGLKEVNDNPPEYEQIGGFLVRQGVKDILPPLLAFLCSAFIGDRAKNLLAPRGKAKKRSPGGA